LLAHLDAQLSTLRNELSTVYRTQAASQNKQLALSDALRDRDEEVRGLREEVRELRETRDGGLRREKDLEDRLRARTKDMEVDSISIPPAVVFH
jgi:predicted  nucleic acid-binding Zn-ribbon protein